MASIEAPFLVVAGVHNETSLGWSAAEAWLERDPQNQVLVTTRAAKAQKFVEAKKDEYKERLDVLPGLDWTEASAVGALERALNELTGGERRLSGVVHAIASAPPENFTTPAHELSPDIYVETFQSTTLSLLRLVQGARAAMRPSAGVVTFGFSEYGRVNRNYGPALSLSKVALSQIVKELAFSLGRQEPSARTVEIVTGFIPTDAGRGVLAGMSSKRKVGEKRIKPADMDEYFSQTAALKSSSSEEQRRNAGLVAVDFIDSPAWSQTTGARWDVNAGWGLVDKSLVPTPEKESIDGE